MLGNENTAVLSPLGSARVAARTTSAALAPFAEWSTTADYDSNDGESSYAWLDAKGHTVRATTIDLGLGDM